MNPLDIVSIVIETNKKYSSFTNKNIKFEHEVDITIPPLHVYTMLSILNNLVSNSIEAIPETGKIKNCNQ
jgi:two-component system, sensor histidine kinase YcbA